MWRHLRSLADNGGVRPKAPETSSIRSPPAVMTTTIGHAARSRPRTRARSTPHFSPLSIRNRMCCCSAAGPGWHLRPSPDGRGDGEPEAQSHGRTRQARRRWEPDRVTRCSRCQVDQETCQGDRAHGVMGQDHFLIVGEPTAIGVAHLFSIAPSPDPHARRGLRWWTPPNRPEER
jgi:hypothetical protein